MSAAAKTHTFRWKLSFDGSSGPVRTVRTRLTSFLTSAQLSEELVRGVVLAFAEALDNACEHGTGGHGTVRVRVRLTPRCIVVQLVDSGSDRVPLGRADTPDEESERGRGFALMNKLMDSVHVRPNPSGGTRVSMLRKLERLS
ncbi:MAG: ATP-binding protein [Planctomycetota bacterium]